MDGTTLRKWSLPGSGKNCYFQLFGVYFMVFLFANHIQLACKEFAIYGNQNEVDVGGASLC